MTFRTVALLEQRGDGRPQIKGETSVAHDHFKVYTHTIHVQILGRCDGARCAFVARAFIGPQFKLRNVFKELAVGTGIGLRYDMEFLVLRLDWGVGLHVPYETGKSGFYNIPKFKDGQAIHLAVGYPF